MDFVYSVRRVDRGVCFKSLNECNNHDDCAQNENCCHQHCCPSEYFQKWKTFPCVSDYFCTNSHLGSKCCLDQNQDTKHCYDYETETCMGNDTKAEVVEVLIELVTDETTTTKSGKIKCRFMGCLKISLQKNPFINECL